MFNFEKKSVEKIKREKCKLNFEKNMKISKKKEECLYT